MNFNDYEQHIIKKCKLALSIAISRHKPQNVTIDEYLKNLSKMNEEDLDATVCMEDFNMDVNPADADNVSVESETILRDFEDIQTMNEFIANSTGVELNNDQLYTQTFCESLNIVNLNNQYIDDAQTYCTQFEHSQSVNDEINNDIQKHEDKETNATLLDSQLTQIYTLYGVSQNDTHYSGTQTEYLEIPQKYITSVVKPDKKDETKIVECTNEITASKRITETNTDVIQSDQYVIENVDIEGSSQKKLENENKDNSQNIVENIDLEVTSEESPVIPFKVLEELSRIKNFLNRRNDEGFSDSGYRSSQLHNSGRSAQNSNTWINQSAYSLFNYIKCCPVIVGTEEIANEISLVLGQLIDWLHEEECYPIFLQELLEYVDVLLQNINEPDNEQILNKDELIYRFILINRSVHIIKYTLEKLTDTLQDLQTKLTNKETCIEIDDIAATENISYVFHILEILLHRYIQSKDVVSQNPQVSEVSVKKSSITDVWRKKWNNNYKESAVVGSCEKKCVLLKCGEVLNKIILEGIEKYSLIAYIALQCYNILQKT